MIQEGYKRRFLSFIRNGTKRIKGGCHLLNFKKSDLKNKKEYLTLYYKCHDSGRV